MSLSEPCWALRRALPSPGRSTHSSLFLLPGLMSALGRAEACVSLGRNRPEIHLTCNARRQVKPQMHLAVFSYILLPLWSLSSQSRIQKNHISFARFSLRCADRWLISRCARDHINFQLGWKAGVVTRACVSCSTQVLRQLSQSPAANQDL